MAQSPSTRTTSGADVGSLLIVVGITMAWLLGTIGGLAFNSGDDGQALLAMLSAIGGTAAFTLLAMRHVARGLELSAAGFAGLVILNIGGSVAGYTGAGPESVLGNLAVLFLPALLLIGLQEWAPMWSRAAGALAGLSLAIAGFDYVLGDDVFDPEGVFVIIGFIALSIAAIGWTLQVWKEANAS